MEIKKNRSTWLHLLSAFTLNGTKGPFSSMSDRCSHLYQDAIKKKKKKVPSQDSKTLAPKRPLSLDQILDSLSDEFLDNVTNTVCTTVWSHLVFTRQEIIKALKILMQIKPIQ